MIAIRDSQTMEFALSCPLDPFLKKLLLKRLDMLSEFSDFDFVPRQHSIDRLAS